MAQNHLGLSSRGAREVVRRRISALHPAPGDTFARFRPSSISATTNASPAAPPPSACVPSSSWLSTPCTAPGRPWTSSGRAAQLKCLFQIVCLSDPCRGIDRPQGRPVLGDHRHHAAAPHVSTRAQMGQCLCRAFHPDAPACLKRFDRGIRQEERAEAGARMNRWFFPLPERLKQAIDVRVEGAMEGAIRIVEVACLPDLGGFLAPWAGTRSAGPYLRSLLARAFR